MIIMLHHIIPYNVTFIIQDAILYHIMSHIIPCHVIYCAENHILSYHILYNRSHHMSDHFQRITYHHIMSNHVSSYHFISYHIMLYNIKYSITSCDIGSLKLISYHSLTCDAMKDCIMDCNKQPPFPMIDEESTRF